MTQPERIRESSVGHFIIGAIPAAIAIITLQLQVSEQFVPEEYRGVLYTGCVGLYVMSATIMLVYTIKRVSDHFSERCDDTDKMITTRADRHDAAVSQVESIVLQIQRTEEKHQRSIQALHSRMETLEKQNGDLHDEVAHLRELVVEDDNLQHNHHRTGPRSLN